MSILSWWLPNFEYILKSPLFSLTPSPIVFCHYILLLLCVCVYPLIYCCNYTQSSYFCLLTYGLALVLVDPLLYDVCLSKDFFFTIFSYLYFWFFHPIRVVPLIFLVILVWRWWAPSVFSCLGSSFLSLDSKW